MDLGGTIKQFRKLKGLTQAQLAEKVDMSVSHISLIEQNKREPSITAAESIASALDMPLSVLVFLATEKAYITELDTEHVEALSKNIMQLMANAPK